MGLGRVLVGLGGVFVGLFVITRFVVFGRFVVVIGGCGVVLCCFLVCFNCHDETSCGEYPADNKTTSTLRSSSPAQQISSL